MQTKILKDRPTLWGGGQRKYLGRQLLPLPHAGYKPNCHLCPPQTFIRGGPHGCNRYNIKLIYSKINEDVLHFLAQSVSARVAFPSIQFRV